MDLLRPGALKLKKTVDMKKRKKRKDKDEKAVKNKTAPHAFEVDKVKAEEKPSEGDLVKQEELAEKSAESSADEMPDNSGESEPQIIKEGEVEYVKVKPRATTKAEEVFKQRQREMFMKRIANKARKSHRERVEEFNAKMAELTEINDIPKISWTK